jgi:integrase
MVPKKRFAEILPAKKLKTLPVGCHSDGRGLYLLVTESGARRWLLRTVVKGGRRREFGLGSLLDVTIDDARRIAMEMREAARRGHDPRLEQRRRAAGAVTYRQAFDSYFQLKRQSLGNAKHLAQWQSTMDAYVFPKIGDRPVGEVTSGEVLAVLEPIWHAKPETAKRVLQRMRAVFDAAILRNWRERASPCVGVAQALGGTGHRKVRHHRAMPYGRVPAFLAMLQGGRSNAVSKLAMEWMVLTATRSGETRYASWSEIDLRRNVWSIPPDRMKSGKMHVIPLPPRCLEILAAARQFRSASDVIFANPRTHKALSDMVFTKILRDLHLDNVATAHGFRSSFRDWATEVDKVREVVAEAALAHSIRDRTEAAYRRTNYLDERHGLMERWAQYLQPRQIEDLNGQWPFAPADAMVPLSR